MFPFENVEDVENDEEGAKATGAQGGGKGGEWHDDNLTHQRRRNPFQSTFPFPYEYEREVRYPRLERKVAIDHSILGVVAGACRRCPG